MFPYTRNWTSPRVRVLARLILLPQTTRRTAGKTLRIHHAYPPLYCGPRGIRSSSRFVRRDSYLRSLLRLPSHRRPPFLDPSSRLRPSRSYEPESAWREPSILVLLADPRMRNPGASPSPSLPPPPLLPPESRPRPRSRSRLRSRLRSRPPRARSWSRSR